MNILFMFIIVYFSYEIVEDLYLTIKGARNNNLSFYEFVKNGKMSDLVYDNMLNLSIILLLIYSFIKK